MSAVPSTFGKYFLTEKIATGGMAEIYLAKLLGPGGFEKFLIIKKIHPELSGERQFVEMFVAEAKTLVGLSHANIVPIYELGMVDSSYFIAMEYIDGPTLAELFSALHRREIALSAAMAAYICAELLKGLDYAHRKGEGVIHRDLSPRNVMLSREGEVKIVDFGIAVASESLGSTGERPAGSYPHMSPEQVRAESLDPRSDVFAAGILLWEMLTGRTLFTRDSDEETLHAVTSALIPRPSEHCPLATGVLDAICARALDRDLETRYASAGEFLIAINRYLYSQAETVSPQDLSRFLAKNCPPTTSEFQRSQSAMGQGGSGADGSPPTRSGTVPIQRSGTVPMARARGKARAETVRTFATHVNFQQVLDSAAGDRPEAPPPPPHLQDPESVPSPHRKRRALPGLVGLALLASAGIAVFIVGAAERPERPVLASPATDAASIVSPAASGSPRTPSDAGPPDATVSARIDAARSPGPRRKEGSAKSSAAPGSIRVGANPWAEVYLNGENIGRAPGLFEVPSGQHQLELRYKDQHKLIPIELEPGERKSLGVIDFHAP